MKKILTRVLAICSALMMCLCLTACNKSCGFGNYSFTHIHITDHMEGECFEVEKWYENSTGIEVMTDKGSIFCSEGTYILFANKSICPYCN